MVESPLNIGRSMGLRFYGEQLEPRVLASMLQGFTEKDLTGGLSCQVLRVGAEHAVREGDR